MTIISKVDSNIIDVCEGIINRVYAVGIHPNNAGKKHSKALHKQFIKDGFTARKRGLKKDEKVKQIAVGDLTKILNSKYKFLEAPITKMTNAEVSKILKAVSDEISGKISSKLAERKIQSALIASAVNPINRMEYGSNAPSTIKIKGFNKPIVDTGETIKTIKAWRIE